MAYTHLILDLDAVPANIDETIKMIDRLIATTPASQIILLAQGYDMSDGVIKDIVSLGIDAGHILTENDTYIKRDLALLLADSGMVLTSGQIDQKLDTTAMNAQDTTPRIDMPVIPPSQVTRAEAKQTLIHKPPVKPTSGLVIALAGAGSRIGTTTQAMQLLLYLRGQQRSVALIEMHRRAALEQYIQLFEEKDVELVSPNHFRIHGCDIFNHPRCFLLARKDFDYIILDYGRFAELQDITSFLDKDVKIICCGVKPWESCHLNDVFEINDGSIHYLFSFVPQADMPEVLALMEESAEMTWFAPYSPDLFRYCGDDETYSAILQLKASRQPARQPSILNRLKGVFQR